MDVKQEENGQVMVEYEKHGRRVYEGADRHVDEDEDFSEEIEVEDLPQTLREYLPENASGPVKDLPEQALDKKPLDHPRAQKISKMVEREVRGRKGFDKLPFEKKKTYLTERLQSSEV